MRSLSTATCFENVTETIKNQNLTRLFALSTSFNSELIKQFYATLYVFGEANDPNSWTLEWMIQGNVFRMSSAEFIKIVNIPRHSGVQEKIHAEFDLTNAEFATLLDVDVPVTHIPENIRPKHLNFLSRTWFYILSNSLIPLSTASDESNLYPETRHAIMKLTHGLTFDFEDCFIRNLVCAAELVFTLKPYAPWLQVVCDYGRNEYFVARHHPKLFLPPVRDTLDMLRKPNDPFAKYVGVRHEVNERNISKRFQKDCHHFEVNLRTQQMLENFIEANQRQMQFLADEVNRVGNIAVNNNLYLRVLKRHSWKGLRKFNSVQGLRKARIYKEYDYLNRNFSRDDTIARPNQKLPPLHKVDEVFFVNEPEPIRPDTNDSVTSKDDEGLDD